MGKGIMAAFIGAALKSAFLKVLNDAAMSSQVKIVPEPAHIVNAVQNHMISQMERFETFVTLCYGRFDLEKNAFVFVDCGHVRTIHYRHAEKSVNLLRGANMPLGFPESRGFMQFQADFSPGDLFVFYSDGVTEAKNPMG
jgi:phosphoserine phosphatase RsbU/P